MKRPMYVGLSLALFLGLAMLDHWLFLRFFGEVHWRWYVSNGVRIGLVTSVTSLAWVDLNRHSRLVSADPVYYLIACLELMGLPLMVYGRELVPKNGTRFGVWDLPERLLTVVLGYVIMAALFVWFIVIAPLQYFVYLVCGSPARHFERTGRRVFARIDDGMLTTTAAEDLDAPPPGWWDASLGGKPVTLTSIISALLLFIVSYLL